MKLLSKVNSGFNRLYQKFEHKYLRISDTSSLATQKIRDLAPYIVKRTTPTKRDMKLDQPVAQEFQMPFFKNDAFVEYMQRFMYSFKNIYSENINSANVCFITGPTKSGKSWFLRYNIRKFENSSQNPIVFHYDFKEQGMLSFDMFLHSFEKMMIETLSKRNAEEVQKNGKAIITDKELMDVVFRFYDESLFEQDLAKCIERATNNYSMTAGFHISSPSDKKDVRLILDKYRNRDYKETPLLNNFHDIAEVVAKTYEGDVFKAKLLMIYDVILRKEQERKQPHYIHTSQHRNGLDVMNFLFDLVNQIAGYSQKYYDEIQEKISHEELVQKYRNDKNKHQANINQSDLLGDKHTHCLLVMEGLQELYKMRGCENLAIDYFDSLILRLHNGSDVWYRNHFPVILESNMNYYMNEQIYNDVQQPEFAYPTIEFLGFDEKNRAVYMDSIFNRDQMKQIDKKLGKSIYFLNVFTEVAKARRGDQTFEQLLELKDPAFEKIRNEFRYRLNKMYTHPLLGDLLDSGDIDYAVLDVLEQWSKFKNLNISCSSAYMIQEFFTFPIVQALLDLNIIYKQKYYNFLYLEHSFYEQVIRDFVKEKLENMTTAERMRYTLYKKTHGLKLGTKYSGADKVRRFEIKNKMGPKQTRIFDVIDLYYEDKTQEQFFDKFFS
eukprot:403359104